MTYYPLLKKKSVFITHLMNVKPWTRRPEIFVLTNFSGHYHMCEECTLVKDYALHQDRKKPEQFETYFADIIKIKSVLIYSDYFKIV